MKTTKSIIIIPSRLSATRLPNKPLAKICGLPMIIQVLKRAIEADIAKILVAVADKEIMDVVNDFVGSNNDISCVLTDPNLPSGSDRIHQALTKFDSDNKYDTIINLQGDLPTVEKSCITACHNLITKYGFDMSTIGAIINNDADKTNSNIVKAVVSFQENSTTGKALYFTRATAPWGSGDLYHHIGIYGYKRSALNKFTSLKPSILELREKLEQLRALENDIKIGFEVVDTIPIGVDTKDDLIKAENYLKQKQQEL